MTCPRPLIGWFVAVVVAIAVVGLRASRGPVTTVAVAVAGTFLTSVLLALLAGVGLSSYYPSKTLWVAAALGLPAVGALVGVALRALEGGSPLRRAGTVVVGTVTGLAVVVSVATPVLGVLRDTWGAADPNAVMRMVTSDVGAVGGRRLAGLEPGRRRHRPAPPRLLQRHGPDPEARPGRDAGRGAVRAAAGGRATGGHLGCARARGP